MAGYWPFVSVIILILLDNAVIQAQTNCRTDFCFVMDESDSIKIGDDNWAKSVQFVSGFMSKTVVGEAGALAGVVKFSSKASLALPLNAHTTNDALSSAILAIPFNGGNGNIHLGIQVAREKCFNPDNGDRNQQFAPNVMILMTDGASSKALATIEADKARGDGITIISIGIGDYDLPTLQAISVSANNIFTFVNFDALLLSIDAILGRACQSVTDCDPGQTITPSHTYPAMTQCPSLNNPVLNGDTNIEFSCVVMYDVNAVTRNARYKVTFLFDDQPDAGVPPITITPPGTTAVLEDKYLYQRLNKRISCQVESYFAVTTTVVSPAIKSRTYFAGIVPSVSTVNVYEGSMSPPELKFFSTLPIPCPSTNLPAAGLQQCFLSLTVSTSSDRILMYQPNSGAHGGTCTYKVYYKDWKVAESAAYDGQNTIQLLAKQDPFSAAPEVVTLNAAANQNKFGQIKGAFSDYTMNDVQINVIDQKPSTCQVRGDPWILTFDRSSSGLSYPAMQQGYFVYVKSTARKFEIQVQQFACEAGGSAGCSVVCGIVVREGKYIMSIDRCNDAGVVYPLSLTTDGLDHDNSKDNSILDRGMEITTDASRQEYMIKTAGGARVLAIARRSRGLDIRITLSARDHGKTQGLCGTFDDVTTNELIPKGETTPVSDSNTSERDRFIESWRVSAAESLFLKLPPDAAGNLDNTEERFCHCAPGSTGLTKADCGISALYDALGDVTNPTEHVRALIPRSTLTPATRRRKRQTVDSNFRTDDVIDFTPSTTADTTANGLPPAWGTFSTTDAQAQIACLIAVDNNVVAAKCAAVKSTSTYTDMKNTCYNDIQRTGSLEWADGRETEFMKVCIFMKATQVVTARNSQALADLRTELQAISNLVCPGACSGHGQCTNGVCTCTPGFIGADCSVTDQVPVLSSYIGDNQCNKEQSICGLVRLVATGVANTPTLTCKVTVTKPTGTTVHDLPGVLETANTVRCPLPSTATVAVTEAYYSYSIAVSNDGTSFSAPLTQARQVVDLKCLLCSNSVCTQKANTCVIDGTCYNNGERVSDCAKCDATKNTKGQTIVGTNTWTKHDNSGSANWKQIVTSTTLPLCQQQCIDDMSCTSIDFDSTNCYIHTGTPVQGTVTAITQFVLTRCSDPSQPNTPPGVLTTTTVSSCVPTYDIRADRSSGNGVHVASVSTLAACKAACISKSACVAIDFDTRNNPSSCWIHLAASDLTDQRNIPGITQYVILDRCPGDETTTTTTSTTTTPTTTTPTTTTPTTTTPTTTTSTTTATSVPGCKIAWSETPNQHSSGGKRQSTLSSTASCQQGCINQATCLAIDVKDNSQCWFHTDASYTTTKGPETGVTQYVLDRCVGACNPAYELKKDTSSPNGVHKTSAKTVDACKKTCVDDSNCVAFDYDTTSSTPCWIHTSQNNLVIQRNTPQINQYILKDRCPGVCQILWTEYAGKGSPGGMKEAAYNTLKKCQDACISSTDCSAIDYVSSTNVCWFHSASGALPARRPDAAATQYVLDRCFKETSTSLPIGQQCPLFADYADKHASGGMRQLGLQSNTACRAGCLSNPNCDGYDFDFLIKGCFSFNRPSPVNTLAKQTGTTHYELVCREGETVPANFGTLGQG